MAVYIVADIEVNDPEAYEKYKALAPATIEQYGGKYLARGGEVTSHEGDWAPKRIIILEFPNREAAENWATSPEYAPVVAIRHAASESRSIMVDGV
jgi:uncharacterized protein (DUF1330 family)